ncbi:MAG TPA: hypothetical protein VF251_02840 [Pyrinomonadaceae bacterium]
MKTTGIGRFLTYMYQILDQPHPLKQLIPAQLKRPARKAVLNYVFRQAMRDAAHLQSGEVPPRELLTRLRVGWDNQGWDAKLDYFETIVNEAAVTDGPILECGSGLTTLLLGQVAGRRNVQTWSLEHNFLWYQRVASALRRHQIDGVNLCPSPLRNYDGFNWYDPPLGGMPSKFSLVICDGPPDLANGGRYGLLPILGSRLKKGAVILFDDVKEPGQPEVLRRWSAEYGVRVELRETEEVSFAVVTCP